MAVKVTKPQVDLREEINQALTLSGLENQSITVNGLESKGKVQIGRNPRGYTGGHLFVHNDAGLDSTTKAELSDNAVLLLQPHSSNSTHMAIGQVNGGNGMGIQVTNASRTANWDIALNPFGGAVGIGTDTPEDLLHLKSTGDTRMTIESPDANDAYINFSGATNEMCLGFDKSDSAMYIPNHGTLTTNKRVTIKTNGNTGIGSEFHAGLANNLGNILNVNNATIIGNYTSGSYFGYNLHYNGAWKYNENSAAGLLSFTSSGELLYRNAVSGADGDTASLTERMQIGTNGAFEIGYAGAALQQADSQALSIITPANGGGQGIALKRLDSNSDQQLGEITFSNNTQDGLGGMRMKTSGAVNTTQLNFDIASNGAILTPLKVESGGITVTGSHYQNGAKVQMQSFDLPASSTQGRRVRISLSNYESCYVRVMAMRTNGGDAIAYWEGIINNNNNANYVTQLHSKSSNPTFTFDYTTTGVFQWDFNASMSPGDGSIYVQDIRGSGLISMLLA